jgi:hypothetical protein
MTTSTTSAVVWQRFVQEPDAWDEDDGAFVEIVRVDNIVYERTGRIDGRERFAKRALASEASAEKSLVRRVAALAKEGYVADDPVSRALPDMVDPRAEREHLRTLAREAIDARLSQFVDAYGAAGFDPTKDFVAACIGKNVHPTTVARTCLELAQDVFQASVARRTRTYDAEHGMRMSVPERLLADFYQRPAYVVALVREKLSGRNRDDDDLDVPGLEDEMQARIVAAKHG